MNDERDYYVSLRRGSGKKARLAILAGPFPTHDEALAMVLPAKQEASRIDGWTDFDESGTLSVPHLPENPKGKLNSLLGISA